MRDLLTPKQISRAMDVSESSVKRWCDKGVIRTHYTAGGHRRITMPALIEFLREEKCRLVRPEALDLPPTSGQTAWVLRRARAQLAEALIAGDDALCRQVAIGLHLAEHRISVICDEVFSFAFSQIGDGWACGDVEIYQERRGCEIMLRLLHELRANLSSPPTDAPLAIGGAALGDHYSLGTTMAELVLRDAKWNAVSLGHDLPFETLSAAIREHRPKLFWLSCSHIADESAFLAGYRKLYEEFGTEVAFVVGGFALTESIRERMKYAAYCDTMQRFEELAATLSGVIEKDVPA